MKLLITGGHVTPAIACIEEIQHQKLPIELVFVGRTHANDSDKGISFEYQEITKRNIPFINLSAGRVTRSVSLMSLQNILKIPSGFAQAYSLLKKIKPDVILSFGGYLAVPVAIVGNYLGIPVYTHEQTIHPGLANKIIANFAKKIFISFPETKIFFDQKKVVVTGNPLRKAVFKAIHSNLKLPNERKVMYITGGSLGAHGINILIEPILKDLLEKYTVIHQTGNVTEFNDYERLSKLRENLPDKLKKYYHLKQHYFDWEIGYIYSIADLVISRSGANTFFELLALKKPAIFIPLPISANQEQQKHAELYNNAGLGEIYEGNVAKELLDIIVRMVNNLDLYKSNSNLSHEYPENAAKTIIGHIITQ